MTRKSSTRHCNRPTVRTGHSRSYQYSMEFKKAKEAHQRELRREYALPQTPERQERINERVRRFNKEHHQHRGYFDMHFMSTSGAEIYFQEILEHMKRRGLTKVLIETGRGNNSSNNEPAIKNLLVKTYHLNCGCTLVQEESNDGILILRLRR